MLAKLANMRHGRKCLGAGVLRYTQRHVGEDCGDTRDRPKSGPISEATERSRAPPATASARTTKVRATLTHKTTRLAYVGGRAGSRANGLGAPAAVTKCGDLTALAARVLMRRDIAPAVG